MSVESLNPTLRDNASVLARQFADAEPFGHLVLEDFLDRELWRRLAAEFPRFDPDRALNEYGEVGGKAVVEDLPTLGPAYAEFDRVVQSREFLDWLGAATGIDGLLYDPEYSGGGTHENAAGQDLDPHVDFNYHPNRGWHRRLNLILFLNDHWASEWGGCLELHRNPWLPAEEDLIRTVVPGANRAVVFGTTESSWHGFRRIAPPAEQAGLTRKSVAVYFYTRERPADQTVAEHGTYYVPRPLPAAIANGTTLTDQDVDELRALVNRRDQQIRYLWERERELREFLEKVDRSPSVRLARTLTWPLRKLRDWGRAIGAREP